MPESDDQTPVETRTVAGWRELTFPDISSALEEADRLAAAERLGKLAAVGNWTLGQALGHVAAWTSYPYEGYPTRPPWFVRIIGRLLKRRLFAKRPPRGFRLPGVPGGTLATEVLPTETGLARFRRAFERLERGAPEVPNPVFGPLTHREWIDLNLGHAALHFGYFSAVTDEEADGFGTR
ncbi:MAG TPA: DUF1569 domain-containing protein [Phycisphaerales bacterium]|nr:DUF1569 domain-containing protein [Phycisphaerales bacterium]HMP38400.1 DUF1569 domain-containing protein [Phycisphaerales bacterium]